MRFTLKKVIVGFSRARSAYLGAIALDGGQASE